MSEPMTSVEIEDVLSSIRRLVSDDQRQKPQPQPQTHLTASGDRLVLTPALRIVPEQAHAMPPVEAVAETGNFEGDGQDEVVFHSVRSPDADEAGFVAVEVDTADQSISPYDDDGAAAPVEGVTAIPLAVFAAGPEPEPEPEAAPRAEPQPADWADTAEAAIRAELEQQTVNTAYARFLDEPEDPVFDEAAMRDLVRDIIREELQGALGERITRNVRKLVRVEIARAMAVRDFE